MMLSEEEAKTKWCPHVRLLEPYAEKTSMNRGNEDEPIGCCLASECMAWRWGPCFWIDPGETSEPKTRYSTDHKPGMELEPAKGFCGLAGPSS
jgi:hypothetical protein